MSDNFNHFSNFKFNITFPKFNYDTYTTNIYVYKNVITRSYKVTSFSKVCKMEVDRQQMPSSSEK